MDANRGIGCAWASSDKTDAGATSQLAIGIGHKRSTTFLSIDDEANWAVVQRVEHW